MADMKFNSNKITLTDTSGLIYGSNTTIIANPDSAGVVSYINQDLPIASGGSAGQALNQWFKVNGDNLFGLIAETDGAGGYREPVAVQPYMSGAYGTDWNTGFTLPTPASIKNGAHFLAWNTTTATGRIYHYLNSSWTWIPFAGVEFISQSDGSIRSTSSTTWQSGTSITLPDYGVWHFWCSGVTDADFATQAQPAIQMVNTSTSFVFATCTTNQFFFSNGTPVSDFNPFYLQTTSQSGNKPIGIQYRRNPNGAAGTVYLANQRVSAIRVG